LLNPDFVIQLGKIIVTP